MLLEDKYLYVSVVNGSFVYYFSSSTCYNLSAFETNSFMDISNRWNSVELKSRVSDNKVQGHF